MRAGGWTRIAWPRLGLAAVLCAVVLTPGHLATPDAHLRLAQARNLVDQGSLSVPAGVGNPAHGNLAPGPEGETHSVYNPGHALLLAPVYQAAELLPGDLHPHYRAAFGASFVGVLAHFLTALVVLAVVLRLGRSPRKGLLVAVLFGFATVSLPLAADGYDHVFEGLAIVLSLFLLVENDGETEEVRPLLAGLVLGAGVLFRYTVLLALPGLLWIARERRARLRILLGLAPALLFMLCYNYYRFGSFFETGYPTAWRLAHGEGIGQAGFRLKAMPAHLGALMASPGKGLLWFSPVLALAPLGWFPFRRARPRVADGIAAIAALHLMFYAANFAWHGSVWSWGPRYVVPIVAPVLAAVAYLPEGRPWRSALWGVVLVSLTVQASATAADHRRYLLEEYTSDPAGFDSRILRDPASSPVIGQFGSAAHVLRSTVEGGDFELFIGSGPWRSVARPASRQEMLDRSIDFNVVDLWWVRLVFISPGVSSTLVAILVGGVGMTAIVRLTRSVWSRAPEA